MRETDTDEHDTFDPTIPELDSDEYDALSVLKRRLDASRRAVAKNIDGCRATVTVYPAFDDDGTLWWALEVSLQNGIGHESWTRHYKSRGDACRSFEYLLGEYERLREVEPKGDE